MLGDKLLRCKCFINKFVTLRAVDLILRVWDAYLGLTSDDITDAAPYLNIFSLRAFFSDACVVGWLLLLLLLHLPKMKIILFQVMA